MRSLLQRLAVLALLLSIFAGFAPTAAILNDYGLLREHVQQTIALDVQVQYARYQAKRATLPSHV
jgi:hypothetical protein